MSGPSREITVDSELLALVKTGGAAMWLIIACSVAAVAVAVERLLALWRFGDHARSLADAVARALFRGDVEDGRAQCERSDSPAAEVFLAALVAGAPGSGKPGTVPLSEQKVAAAVERQRQQVNLKLRQNLWMLGTIGATAPFIGLFGTVVGIMRAFHQMGITGQGGFSVVAAGISEALVTTAGGIAVAVEAVVIYNFLNTHVQKLAMQLKLLTEEYLEIVKERLPALGAAQPEAHPGG
jgi:biopolymer transport protein ExbB